MTRPETILLLSDPHFGSIFAGWPDGWLPKDPTLHLLPRYLNNCFAYLDEVLPKKIDCVLLGGDLVEGKQRKQGGVSTFTPCLGEQVEGCIEMLEPILSRAGKIMRTPGTPYHEDFDEALLAFDQAYDAQKLPTLANIPLGDQVLNFAHTPSSKAKNKGTSLGNEENAYLMALAKGKADPARWIIRGHLHSYKMLDSGNRTIMLLPCMKAIDDHALRANAWDFIPDIGCVLMIATEDGYMFKPILFDPIKPEVLHVEWENAQETVKAKRARNVRREGKHSKKPASPRVRS